VRSDGDPDQHSDHGLGHRVDRELGRRTVPVAVALVDNPAVPRDEDSLDPVELPCERGIELRWEPFIDPLVGRCGGRPDARIGDRPASVVGAAGRERKRKRGEQCCDPGYAALSV
jgi:hypothetical protein